MFIVLIAVRSCDPHYSIGTFDLFVGTSLENDPVELHIDLAHGVLKSNDEVAEYDIRR